MGFWRKKEYWIVFGIVVLAAFLRFWQINSIPPGLYPDEAMNGINALEALENTDFWGIDGPKLGWKVFYPENNGREGLFINLQSVSLAIFGPEPWTLRGVSAFFGSLTILGLYLLARELFGKNPAYFSAFFMAVSFWHINFSRIGFRAIMVPFFTVFAFYFLFKALRTQKLYCYILAGVSLGLGLHTYIAFRFVPILAILILAVYFLEWWQNHKFPLPSVRRWYGFFFNQGFRKFNIFLAVSVLCVLPLAVYFFNNPGDFIGRSGQVSVFASDNVIRELIISSGKSFLKLFWHGDYNWRHNLAGAPQILWPVGILFVIGFAVSVKEIIRQKFRGFGFWFLVFGFFIMSLPEILTTESLPHALRSIGTIPFVFMFAGLGARAVFSDMHWKTTAHQIWCYAGVGAIIAAIAFLGVFQYFYLWDNRAETQDAFSQGFVDIGRYLRELPPEIQKTVIVNLGGVLFNGVPMPAATVKFIAYGQKNINYLTEETLIPGFAEKFCRQRDVIIPMIYDQNLFDKLKILLPGQTQIKKVKDFWVFQCE